MRQDRANRIASRLRSSARRVHATGLASVARRSLHPDGSPAEPGSHPADRGPPYRFGKFYRLCGMCVLRRHPGYYGFCRRRPGQSAESIPRGIAKAKGTGDRGTFPASCTPSRAGPQEGWATGGAAVAAHHGSTWPNRRWAATAAPSVTHPTRLQLLDAANRPTNRDGARIRRARSAARSPIGKHTVPRATYARGSHHPCTRREAGPRLDA